MNEILFFFNNNKILINYKKTNQVNKNIFLKSNKVKKKLIE